MTTCKRRVVWVERYFTLSLTFFKSCHFLLELLLTKVRHVQSRGSTRDELELGQRGCKWLLEKKTDKCFSSGESSHVNTSKKMAVNRVEGSWRKWVAGGVNGCRGHRSFNTLYQFPHNHTDYTLLLYTIVCLKLNPKLHCYRETWQVYKW